MSNLLVIFRPRWQFETQDFVDYPTLVNQLDRMLEIVDMFLVVVIATDTYVEIVFGEILQFATIPVRTTGSRCILRSHGQQCRLDCPTSVNGDEKVWRLVDDVLFLRTKCHR